MSLNDPINPDALSRRHLLAGLGLATGAASVLAALPGGSIAAAAPAATADAGPFPQAFLPETPGLTYALIDPSAFFPTDGGTRNVNDNGAFLSTAGNMRAPIDLPKNAVIKQVNFTYVGSPTVALQRKPFAGAYASVESRTLSAGSGGIQNDNFSVDELVDGTATYSFNVSVANSSQSIGALIIGYQAPSGAFVPFSGGTPRVLDSRVTGGKLEVGEERIVSLGLPSYARAAIFNLTITQTENPNNRAGYVSAFKGDIGWPGNSSINWTTANDTLANLVICPVDSLGRIKLRAGENRTHVIVDLVGSLV